MFTEFPSHFFFIIILIIRLLVLKLLKLKELMPSKIGSRRDYYGSFHNIGSTITEMRIYNYF